MSLASIPPWLRPLWEGWRSAHAAGRLPHALLVAGPPGSGKRELAETFARGALCRAPADGLPCGACPSCKQFASHRQLRRKSHPDIDWVTASRYSIGVDDVREQVIARLARTASYDRFKFLVIEPAERMTRAAANALLKSLEEPPPRNALFLLSHQPGRLPPTIRSRCQKFVLPEPAPAEARAWLLGQLGEEDAAAALEAAEGRPLHALQMHRDGQVPLRAAFEQGPVGGAGGPAVGERVRRRLERPPGGRGGEGRRRRGRGAAGGHGPALRLAAGAGGGAGARASGGRRAGAGGPGGARALPGAARTAGGGGRVAGAAAAPGGRLPDPVRRALRPARGRRPAGYSAASSASSARCRSSAAV